MSHFHIRKAKKRAWNSVNSALKPVFASKIIKNCEKSKKRLLHLGTKDVFIV